MDPDLLQFVQQIQSKYSYSRFTTRLCHFFGYRERGPIDLAPVLTMEIDALLAILLKESRKSTAWKRLGIGLGILLMVLILSQGIYKQEMPFETLFRMCIPVGLICAGGVASLRQQAVAAAITQFDDVRALGPLAEVLEFRTEPIVPIAEKALIRLLPRLQAQDASLLSSAQRACLNRALEGGNTGLTLAILKAWEQVGDADALPIVERLAEGRRMDQRILPTKTDRQNRMPSSQKQHIMDRLLVLLIGAPSAPISEADRPAIMTAAQACLAALRLNRERRQLGAQLLRPSSGDNSQAEVLLRPLSAASTPAPAEQLLRPIGEKREATNSA